MNFQDCIRAPAFAGAFFMENIGSKRVFNEFLKIICKYKFKEQGAI